MRKISLLIGIALVCMATPAYAKQIESLADWQPEGADEVFVDVKANIGYILHENADYISFPLATGVRKKINWIGKTYFAATPVDSWVIKAKDTQSDRIMFGKTGRFFRLYVDGERTSYGIHGYAYFQKWLKEEDRYKSYGCIVVSEEILDILDTTYAKAGKTIRVTTMSGTQPFLDKLALHEQKIEGEIWKLLMEADRH